MNEIATSHQAPTHAFQCIQTRLNNKISFIHDWADTNNKPHLAMGFIQKQIEGLNQKAQSARQKNLCVKVNIVFTPKMTQTKRHKAKQQTTQTNGQRNIFKSWNAVQR